MPAKPVTLSYKTVELLPVAAVFAAIKGDKRLCSLAATALVKVGTRPEVDITELPPILSEKLSNYKNQLETWNPVSGINPILVRTIVYHERQIYTKTAKRDLNDALSQLDQWPVTEDVIDSFLVHNQADAVKAGEQSGWKVKEEPGSTTLAYTIAPVGWPDLFGGAANYNEIEREIAIVVKHANWRDRRVRRLGEVKVSTITAWPTPRRKTRVLPE